jgi:hypothetical protein
METTVHTVTLKVSKLSADSAKAVVEFFTRKLEQEGLKQNISLLTIDSFDE